MKKKEWLDNYKPYLIRKVEREAVVKKNSGGKIKIPEHYTNGEHGKTVLGSPVYTLEGATLPAEFKPLTYAHQEMFL